MRAYILNLQAKLTKPHKRRDALFTTLKCTKQAIRQSTQRLMGLDQQLLNKDNHFHQYETFTKQIRSAYIASCHETVKLLKLFLSRHNQLLFKEAGDWVDTREIITQVNNSSRHQQVGIYLELRYQEKEAY